MAKHDKRAHGTRGHTLGAGHRQHAERRQEQTEPMTEAQRAEVTQLLAEVPALADQLRAAAEQGREAVAAQLATVEAAPEPVQRAFAARLGDVRGPDARAAAEVAHALGELASAREVAREARRARIRLRSAGALPTLNLAPATQGTQGTLTAEPQATAPSTPRLVEAHVTRTREEGEISLSLAWQEGSDPDIVRGAILLLDFWRDGAKDVTMTAPMTRRRFVTEYIARFRTETKAETMPISWAQARGLLLEALDVNAWRGTEPGTDYRRHQGLLTARLLDVPDSDEARAAVADEEARAQREGDRPYMAGDLEPDELVATWLGTWTFGDFGASYDLLADDNPIRRELTRDEYIAQRRGWADEAKPASLRLTLVREQAQRASALWVPGAAGVVASGGRREMEAFWSITLNESPLGGAISELPLATLSSTETGRHWYWTAYTVERDRGSGAWRIVRLRDEGAASQALTIEELQKRIQEARDTATRIAETTQVDPQSEEGAEALRQVTGALVTAMHYRDALMTRLPLDESLYRDNVNDAQALRNYERSAAVLERMQGRFPGQAHTSFELGVQYFMASTTSARVGDVEAEHAWLERAERALTQAVEADPSAEHLQGLGEVLGRRGHFTQAVARFRESIERDPSRASAHSDLADALMSEVGGENLDAPAAMTTMSEKDRADLTRAAGRAALAELREAARLDRSLPSIHTRIGAIYDVLGQPEDALLAFQEAVRQDPNDAEARYTVGTLYLSRGQPALAVAELEAAAQLSPLALTVRINLAAAYMALERWRDAERELNFVDETRPGMPQVAELRSRLAQLKRK